MKKMEKLKNALLQTHEGIILHNANFDGKKTRHHSCRPFVLSEVEWFLFLFSDLRCISYELKRMQTFS